MGNASSHKETKSSSSCDKTANIHVVKTALASNYRLPLYIKTLDEFGRLWFSWKEMFLKSLNSHKFNTDKGTSVDTLLNHLGPVGQEIWQTFTFVELAHKENLNIVLRKFDIYCAFGNKKKQPSEDVHQYINDLKMIAERYFSNVDEIVREKVYTELYEYCIKNSNENERTILLKYKNLTLIELAYGWQIYENNFLKKHKYKGTNMIVDCINCGIDHFPNACPAQGKVCTKCNNLNHRNIRCPISFIAHCKYCGSSHTFRHCPAYGQTCSNCKEKNHFAWKCIQNLILNCRYCGLKHVASKAKCPAVNTYCALCKTVGHFPSKCRKNSH